MLGENHSLIHEFPEHKDLIALLIQNQPKFAQTAKQYDDLDAEIRNLELANSPIDDQAMHQLKHDRSALKDRLYQALIEAQIKSDQA